MSLNGIASKMGITESSLQQLISGQVSAGVASKLNVTASSLQDFVNGGTSVGLASRIGWTSSTLQELRNDLGRESAIGLLIGLCINTSGR